MMNHKKIYIYGAILASILTSCNDFVDMPGEFLEGQSKTPIAIQTNLSAAPVTRAFDKKFEKGDILLAYIEAGVTADGTFSSADNPFKGLQTLTLTADADNTDGDNHADLYNYTIATDGPHITETEDAGLQKLYWDNYSSTTHDLRNDGAGIRLKYGYCYNGGTPTTPLNETAGTLGWTLGDQTTAEAFKKADLLFAKTQDPVSYVHGTSETDKHGVLVLPYSHAMSKITVNVTANEGFNAETENFASSVLKLQHMNTACSVDAPNGKVTSDTPSEIVTLKSEVKNTSATYQAIIAPGTNLSVGNLIATISNVDGNNYDIPITGDLVYDWKERLTTGDAINYEEVAQIKTRAYIYDAEAYLTQPGVHYVLNVIIDKQKITVRATLADWDKVTASANGQITFDPDITGKGTIATALQTGGFDVYKSSTNGAFLTKSTTLTFADSKWSYSPIIYWAGQSDASYFRAVSPKDRDDETLEQGVDLLWGTSGAEDKSGTSEELSISPRTGDVPLTFEHLMSKLCINLQTVSGDAAVDLTDAKIAISKLATSGTYNIVDGTVTAGSPVETMLSDKPSGFTETVIPQTIGDNAKVTITLKDGTTYSVQLNQCVLTGTTTTVSEWTKGKSYTYTITLSKQEITFSAEVKDWVEQSASGNATLDWD